MIWRVLPLIYYIDTCILLYASFRHHRLSNDSLEFFNRVRNGNYNALVSIWTMSEFRNVGHLILFENFRVRNQIQRDKRIQKEISNYFSMINLKGVNIRKTELVSNWLEDSFTFQSNRLGKPGINNPSRLKKVGPSDIIHYKIALLSNCNAIITADEAFQDFEPAIKVDLIQNGVP